MSFIRSLVAALRGAQDAAPGAPPAAPQPKARPVDPLPQPPPDLVIGEQDPRIAAAIAQAKAQWPDFMQAYHRRAPRDVFVVKAPLREGEICEWMWISLASISGDELVGILEHVPGQLKNIRKGDQVRIKTADLGDWMYSTEGKLIGGFTQDLLD